MSEQNNEFDILTINGYPFNTKDTTARNDIASIIGAIQVNNASISGRINDLNERAFEDLIKISSNDETEISDIDDGMYKIQYVTVETIEEEEVETINNTALLIQKGINQYLIKDGQILSRTKTNDTWDEWQIPEINEKDIKLNNISIESENDSINIKTSEYINKYFSIINRQTLSSYIKFDMNGTANLYYSDDEGETWNLYTSGDVIELPGTGNSSSATYNGKAYSKVMFKGNLITLNTTSNNYSGIGNFSVPENYTSNVIDIEGNILSLLFGDDFLEDNKNKDNSSHLQIKNYQFRNLFANLTIIKDASNLILPSYELPNNAYRAMFGGCTSLKNPPIVLAKYANTESFRYMFYDCASLLESLYLRNIILISSSLRTFYQTYSNCTSLVKAHDITCENIGEQCFYQCFLNCTSLIIAPQINTNSLSKLCFQDMFSGCTNLRELPNLPWTTLVQSCYQNMFNHCDQIKEIPIDYLPATELVKSCYSNMFAHCVNLEKIALKDFTLADGCCQHMLAWCEKIKEITFLSTDDYTNYTDALREINYHNSKKYRLILNDSQTWFDIKNKNPFSSNIFVYNQSRYEVLRKFNLNEYLDTTGYKNQYLTFISRTSGVLRFTNNFSYSLDKLTWINVNANEDTEVFDANVKIYCKNITNTNSFTGIGTFLSISKAEEDADSATYEGTEEEQIAAKEAALAAANKIIEFDIEGNPISMRYGDDFFNKDISNNYIFKYLFKDNTKLINAENLYLGWSHVYRQAYEGMFNNCINLITNPKIPALNFDYMSCRYMFGGCTSLTTFNGDLTVTNMESDALREMFYGCTSLVRAPELNITADLTNSCCKNMFYNCSSLKFIKALFTNTTASNCLTDWVKNVSQTGIFVKSDNNTNWPSSRGTSTVLEGWTIYNESEWESPHRYELNDFAKTCEDIGAVIDYSKQYLTFEAKENGTFQFTNAINYSVDNGITWVSLAANTATPTITANNKIMWKAELTPALYNGIGSFSSTGNFNIEGNIMSLLFGDNFKNQTDLSGKDYAFYNLFNGAKVINAENLSLPTTTVYYCYYGMFYNCTSLTVTPELPATTLAYNCYNYMFYNCTNLTVAPELPATTLANYCYSNMFQNCTNLAMAPELPATTLAVGCYNSMFYDCTNLMSITCLATDISASSCTTNWVNGVAASGTFIKANTMNSWTTGNNGIPTGWDVYTEDEYKIVRKYELNGYIKNIKLNNNFLTKENGTVNIEISGLGLPAVTSSDNGKILMVVNGQWQLVSPSTLYSGNSVPNNTDGNNGDLYIQTD